VVANKSLFVDSRAYGSLSPLSIQRVKLSPCGSDYWEIVIEDSDL